MLRRLLAYSRPPSFLHPHRASRRCLGTTASHGAASLSLDIILRRMQSSSLTNKARSLDAHFADAARTNNSSNVNGSTLTSSSSLPNSLSSGDAVRTALSERLLHEVNRHTSASHLSLDDVSLIAANAVRHRLSPVLLRAVMPNFFDAIGCSSGGGGAESREMRQAEALVRIMEACVDVEEVFRGSGSGSFTLTEWALLVAAVEQRWRFFMMDPSTTCLLPQFLSLALAEAVGVMPSSSSAGSSTLQSSQESSALPLPAAEAAAGSGGMRYGLANLQADKRLLQERCVLLCERATTSMEEDCIEISEGGDGGSGGTCRPAELVRLCHAIQRIKRYEYRDSSGAGHNTVGAAGGGQSGSTAAAGKEHESAGSAAVQSSSAPPTSASSNSGGVVATAASFVSKLWSSSPASSATAGASSGRPSQHHRSAYLYRRLGLCMTAQAAAGNPPRPPRRGSDSSLPSTALGRASLQQVSTIFATVCDTAPTEVAADLSFSVCAVLQMHDICADVVSLDSILSIGEVCTRVPDGTQMVLVDVLKSLQRSSFSLLLPTGGGIFPATGNGADDHLVAVGELWSRACELVVSAPLTMCDVADRTLFSLIKALQHPSTRTATSIVPTFPSSESIEMAVEAPALPSHGAMRCFCSRRYGTLLLAWQLLRRPRGYLSAGLEAHLHELVELLPFSSAADGRGLPAAVRAVAIYATLASNAKEDRERGERYTQMVTRLMKDINTMLKSSSSGGGYGRLTEHERSLLRNVIRAMGDTLSITPGCAATAASSPTPLAEEVDDGRDASAAQEPPGEPTRSSPNFAVQRTPVLTEQTATVAWGPPQFPEDQLLSEIVALSGHLHGRLSR